MEPIGHFLQCEGQYGQGNDWRGLIVGRCCYVHGCIFDQIGAC
jgi:hypothetical protein